MAIFRCNKCAHLQECADTQVGSTVLCPRCGHPGQAYQTLFFVGRLLDKYFEARREVIRLTPSTDGQTTSQTMIATPPSAANMIDLSNTDQLASKEQHEPIVDWFRRKQVAVQANLRGVDTTGFFDEVAMAIGSDLPLVKDVLERIRWAQQREYPSTSIPLVNRSAEDVQAISAFCERLHEFSFLAKYIPDRQKNRLLLVLQTAPAIRQFFNGEWLEWYVLMTCLQYARERRKSLSCARRLSITLTNNDSHELDVFALIDGQLPICIECKAGEFRQDIDKYLNIRKRLGLDGKNFVICVAGLSEEHAKGLSAMYDLGFVSERELLAHLARLF
ncbi:MAG TPA: hypothetical protein PLO14_08740 [Accumulibacter sp.]|uniref:Card1-like endonuclease domain-containing protein n=1 Tax=Accumulibacter sp. TaxID=2053492 RepID=UPI0025E75906|nr:hypothetical protein [Accumulibacter sp.]MCM8597545.1 hypothetical protein [Accumulibacter sp.]MCM8661671.1 hypothetical protein [Accumulibacter sp.]HNC52305.1 hypothetical protein [Accumulibacter sp.]